MAGRVGFQRWAVVLVGVGVGWLLATSLTVLGMVMTACHAKTRHPALAKTSSSVLKGVCGWSLGSGYSLVAVGSLLNVALLVLMLVCIARDRKGTQPSPKPDLPPDYESLIKEETPPPSYSELFHPSESTSTIPSYATPRSSTSTIPSSLSLLINCETDAAQGEEVDGRAEA